MKIYLGSDHAGYNLKEKIKEFLLAGAYEVEDLGVDSAELKSDYPDNAKAVGEKVAADEASLGVLVCGSGAGVCIAANKVHGIRAVNVYSEEIAKYARLHNNANIICFGERFVQNGNAIQFLQVFLNTEFEGGRHAARVEKISQMEK